MKSLHFEYRKTLLNSFKKHGDFNLPPDSFQGQIQDLHHIQVLVAAEAEVEAHIVPGLLQVLTQVDQDQDQAVIVLSVQVVILKVYQKALAQIRIKIQFSKLGKTIVL